jgi:hypothetical protein
MCCIRLYSLKGEVEVLSKEDQSFQWCSSVLHPDIGTCTGLGQMVIEFNDRLSVKQVLVSI